MMEERAMSQGMRATSRSQKGHETNPPLESQGRNAALILAK